eukprot:XP_001694455.1 predicted protein [Chlamydomonas reinhardtii]
MFGAAARIAARPAAAAAAAGVAANAAQGSAQARAPAQSAGRQAVHAPVHNNKLVDRDVDSGWLDVVLFQPFNTQELDQAADTVLALFGGSAGPSTSTSASTSAGPILRRPGMQREVVLCMLEDTEVRELMMRQCSDLGGGVGGPGGLVSKLVGAVAGAIERAGDALACLGGWVRRHLAASLPFVGPADHQPQATAGAWGEAQEGVEEEGVLGGVMALAVAVFAVAVIRRPLVLRQLSRSFR